MFRKRNKEMEQIQRDKFILYKQVFLTEQGKEVLRNLMDNFHILNSHNGDAYKEGQRSVVLYILQNCNMNIDRFDQLVKDYLEGEM